MKASEFRIGNYVFSKVENKPITMGGNGIHNIQEGRIPTEYMPEPIKLTEEWLLKFGFEKKGIVDDSNNDFDNAIIYQYKNYYVFFWEDKYWYVYGEEADDDYGFSYFAKEIRYVHKLQNIHFELHDKELKQI